MPHKKRTAGYFGSDAAQFRDVKAIGSDQLASWRCRSAAATVKLLNSDAGLVFSLDRVLIRGDLQ